jgi:L1 cell adhesion molecule like protein
MTSAEAAKTAGNAAFKDGDFKKAVEHFTEAINAEPNNASFYSNRSAAHLKLSDTAKALADANKCIELKPEWSKGYSRAGSALLVKGDIDEAIAIYTKGLTIDPKDKVLEKALGQAKNKLAGGKKKRNRRNRKKKEEKAEEHEHVIGIDLGTTYSCVGVWKDGGVKILELPNGSRTIPSYVAFTDDGERLVGQAAKAQAARNTPNTIFDVKRIIGQRWSDNGVEKDCSHFPFKVTPDDQGRPTIEIEESGATKEFQPEQISALVLSYCKKLAEDFLGEKVGKAVITVPAYFNDSQRNATKAAGAIAGLEVMRIINEPTAAALAYGLDSVVDKAAGFDKVNVLIFDLGGGTFDVSILTIEDGVFTVKATGGDTRLGGEDFDNNLIAYLHTEVEAQGITHVEKDESGRAFQRLRKAAELAKRELSSAQTADIKIEDLMDGKTFELQLTRTKFEKLNTSLFTTCMATVERVLKDAKMKTKDINEIVMVGGSTRIPKIQEMLALEIFKGRTLCKSLNPDEAVAYGAAVQGAILSGRKISKTEDLLLMDVTPLSLGIETTGRVMSVIIPRNTPIPCVKTQTYTTESNYQTQVDVSVYEGERLKSDENNLLGEFTISGIQSAKRGEPQVDVSFSIDSNGILKVEAIDQKTKAQADISIANRSQASSEDVRRMIEEAEKYKKEDEARIKKVEAKNELEATILEAMELGREIPDGKLGGILLEAAEKDQEWLESNYETATAGDIGMRRATLNRRMAGQNRR